MLQRAVLVLLCTLLPIKEVYSCGACVSPDSVPTTHVVKSYQPSQEHVENPHRGFVNQMVTHSGSHHALTVNRLEYLRNHDGITMIWRTFVLDTFVTSSISNDYLNTIRHDLDIVEAARFTVVLRFCYIFEMRQDHPWGDASKNIVLRHIQQLTPIFHRFEGVITSIEAGFIGAWGEWHHTEYFGNPSYHTAGHDPVTGLMPQAFHDRKEVLLALLRAAPKSIQIQLRYPAQKMHMMGNETASLQGVQQGDDNDRTGHHNDCFLSSDRDVGTYKNKAVEYPYLEHDTRYTIMGGETCSLTDNGRHDCPTARQELAMFHWTFLNEGYNQDIYAVWKQHGCYEEVHRKLGYRLAINKAILPSTARVNEDMCFHLEFSNDGYAAPVKDLRFYIVLKSVASGSYYRGQVMEVETRDWQPGYTHTVSSALNLTLPDGQYQVLVMLGDPLLERDSDYNVLLASNAVPIYTQGLNDLGHTLTVSGMAGTPNDCPAMIPWSAPHPSTHSRIFTGSF